MRLAGPGRLVVRACVRACKCLDTGEAPPFTGRRGWATCRCDRRRGGAARPVCLPARETLAGLRCARVQAARQGRGGGPAYSAGGVGRAGAKAHTTGAKRLPVLCVCITAGAGVERGTRHAGDRGGWAARLGSARLKQRAARPGQRQP